MEAKWLMIFFCTVVLCITAGYVVDRFAAPPPPVCHGGVFDADGFAVPHADCRGARVTVEERGGKRYAVCSCDTAACAADAGADARLVEEAAP